MVLDNIVIISYLIGDKIIKNTAATTATDPLFKIFVGYWVLTQYSNFNHENTNGSSIVDEPD